METKLTNSNQLWQWGCLILENIGNFLTIGSRIQWQSVHFLMKGFNRRYEAALACTQECQALMMVCSGWAGRRAEWEGCSVSCAILHISLPLATTAQPGGWIPPKR